MIMSTPQAPAPHVFTQTRAASTADLGYQVAGAHQSPRGAGGGMSFSAPEPLPPPITPPPMPGTEAASNDSGNDEQPGGAAELGGMGGALRHLSGVQFGGAATPGTEGPAPAAGESAASAGASGAAGGASAAL
jgi:hypothetical protein